MTENEKQKAHRIFKYYKAKGEFPKDIKPLESYQLLAKYNYFIAKDFDKKKIDRFIQANKLLEQHKIILVYGDIELNTLKFMIKEYFTSIDLKFMYIDYRNSTFITELNNSIPVKSLKNNTIFYIIDNIEKITASDIKILQKAKSQIMNYSKYIILCAYDIDKVKTKLKEFKQIQLGDTKPPNVDLRKCLLYLLCEENRLLASNFIKDADIYIKYFLRLALFNIPFFYKSETDIDKNISIIENVDRMCYKVNTEKVIDTLVFSFIVSKTKRPIKFPPKLESKNENLSNNVTSSIKT